MQLLLGMASCLIDFIDGTPFGLRLFTNERDLQIYIYSPLFTNQVQKMFYIDIRTNNKNEPSLKASFIFILSVPMYANSIFS